MLQYTPMNVQSTGIARFTATAFVVVIAVVGFAIPKSADAAYQYGIGASICGNDPFMYCGNLGYKERSNGQWQVTAGGTVGFGNTYSTYRPASRPTYYTTSHRSAPSVYTVGSAYSRQKRPVYVGSRTQSTYVVTSNNARAPRTSYPNWLVMY